MVVFARGFRPFFLLAALEAAVAVPWWLALWAGALPPPAWLSPMLWHAHEMVFGFVAAAAAGFLLTAVPTWTGSRPIAGAPLAALAALWLAGRVAMALAGALPLALVAALDVAFLAALAVVVARPILSARQARNAGVPLVLAALAAVNAATQLDALGIAPGLGARVLHGGVDLAVVLITLIGGRIVPSFTANALRRSGSAAAVHSRPALDRAALVAVVAYAVLDVALPRTLASGALALAAGLAVAARMSGWQTRRTLADPLLWSLHLGYAWVALGLIAVGLADLSGAIPWTIGLHALTAGAIGTMVLAVMTRVPLGHTGRPLAAPRAATAAYLLVSAGALARTAGALAFPDAYSGVLLVAALLWSGAYAVFVARYAPILLGPRVDGQPG